MIKKMEQILVETGELFTTASGISMLPCIRPASFSLLYEEYNFHFFFYKE